MKCCKSKWSRAHLVVFGYLKSMQNRYFPEDIYYICLQFYEGDYTHYIANDRIYKFDDINDFEISLDDHKHCIMPSFELIAIDDTEKSRIKKWYLSTSKVHQYFELLRVIGSGSFSKVYLVKTKDSFTGKNEYFAMKCMRKSKSLSK